MSSHAVRRSLLLLIFVWLLWEFAVYALKMPDYLLPTPRQVFSVFGEDASILFHQTLHTIIEWLIGLFVSIILGFCFALACFRFKPVHDFFSPLLIVSQTIPFLAIAPLLLIWLGLGMAPKIVLVVLSCSFPIALALEEGLQQGRQTFHLIVAMIKLPWISAVRHVYLPAALPHFFTGLKISASYAFVSTVMAELIGSEKGLGIYLTRAQSSYRTDRVVAAILVTIAVSLLNTLVVDLLRRRIVFWDSTRK